MTSGAVSDAELLAAADEFRRAVGLLAAEEMDAWLADNGLGLPEWLAWVERALTDPDPGARTTERTPPSAPLEAATRRAAAAAGLDRRQLVARLHSAARRGAQGDLAPPPVLDPRLSARPESIDRERLPYIPTARLGDCGAAALAAVGRYYGGVATLDDVRALLANDGRGTTLLALAAAARQLGLHARTLKASRRNLEAMPLPAIVHLDGHHWVVLYAVEPHEVHISDPSLGPRRIAREQFAVRWSGYALLVAPAERPKPPG